MKLENIENKRVLSAFSNFNSINAKGSMLVIIIITIIILLILLGTVISINLKENEMFKIAKYEEINNKTEIQYEIIEKVGTKYKILIVAKNDSGIQKIECPNGLEITCNNKNKVAIDYEVEENVGNEFAIEISNKKDTFIININSSNEIIINENTSNAYPIITEDEITVGKKVNISYGGNTDLYYSLDNGNTWLEYNGEIKFSEEGIIKVKTVIQDGITQIASKKITLNLASDAMPLVAYDGNYKSECKLYNYFNNKKMMVDPSMYGKTIWITGSEQATSTAAEAWKCKIYAYLNDGSNTIIHETPGKDPSYNRRGIVIPQSTQYLIFNVGTATGCRWDIKEIEVK